MIFAITYDLSVTAEAQAVINTVAQFFETHYADDVTINITASMADLSPNGLGRSNWPFNSYSYSAIQGALAGDTTTTDDSAAIANSVPGTDPISGTHTYWMVRAEAKALGLITGDDSGSDGSVTFNSVANTFDFDRTDGITAGLYDFAGTVAHELTEVMGRSLNVGQTITDGGGTDHPNSNFLFDLFHYSADGVRSFVGTSAGYFSLDNGHTNLDDFNTNTGGDFGDWAGTTLVGNDLYLAFSSAGVVNAVMTTDFRVMDILGWDLVNQAPTATALTGNVTEDGPTYSQDLLSSAADADADYLVVQNLGATVATSDGRNLALGTDYTLTGSTIALTSAGFAKFNSLSQGTSDTVVFGYDVTDFLASAHNTLTLTVNGLNDLPVINVGSSVLAGSVNELAFTTGSLANDLSSGAIAFTDPDLDDLPTGSINAAAQTITWQDAGHDYTAELSPAQLALFQGAFTISAPLTNTNIGVINWDYTVVDHQLDFLGAGESITVTTPVIIDDHNGGTVSQDIVVTINGADDNPIAAPDSNGVAKNSSLSVSAANGVLSNDTDPDVHDQGNLFVSAISGGAVGAAVAGTYGSLILNADGSYGYTPYKGALPAKIVAQDVFTYTAADGHGGTGSSTLSIVVTSNNMEYLTGANTTLDGSHGLDLLDGSPGHDILIGGTGADILIGGDGNTMTGNTGPDTFLFRPNFGANVITDFNIHIDNIQFDKSIFVDLADILSHTADTAAGAVITDVGGDSITLNGVTLAQLQAHPPDFYLV